MKNSIPMEMPEGYAEMNDTEREYSGKGKLVLTEMHYDLDPISGAFTRISKYDINYLFADEKCIETVIGHMEPTDDVLTNFIEDSSTARFYGRRLNANGWSLVGSLGVLVLTAGAIGLSMGISD